MRRFARYACEFDGRGHERHELHAMNAAAQYCSRAAPSRLLLLPPVRRGDRGIRVRASAEQHPARAAPLAQPAPQTIPCTNPRIRDPYGNAAGHHQERPRGVGAGSGSRRLGKRCRTRWMLLLLSSSHTMVFKEEEASSSSYSNKIVYEDEEASMSIESSSFSNMIMFKKEEQTSSSIPPTVKASSPPCTRKCARRRRPPRPRTRSRTRRGRRARWDDPVDGIVC